MKYDLFDTVLFTGFIGALFAGSILLPDAAFSETENRTLQQKPSFSVESLLSGEFTKNTETYIADQFPLRDHFVEGKSVMEKMWGKRENNGVYHCSDQLIERFDAPDPARIESNIAAVNRLNAATDVPVYLSIVPTAASIQSDRLPEGAPNADQDALIEQIYAGVTSGTIDQRPMLAAHREDYLFYRTDHHWTTLGAYYGAAKILGNLGYEIAPLDSFTPEKVTDSFNGTLYSSSGYRDVTPDEITLYVPSDKEKITVWKDGKATEGKLYDRSFLEKKDKYSMFMGGNTPLSVIETGNSGKKLLIVRDSYADSMVPFLLPYFSEIHLFDARYYKKPISQYIAENEIDEAVLLFSLKNFAVDSDFALAAK